jgi:4,5-dihydroxyphthalate decarboxylase
MIWSDCAFTLSCNEYDRTRFLLDGTVQAESIDLTVVSLPSEERHRRFSRDLEFDVCELQMGVFLGWMGRDSPFSAIPVFPHRKFCHGNVLLNTARGIQKPEELAGKIIGMRAHFNPVSLWMRGVLQEEYGVAARSLRIRTNQREQALDGNRRIGWKSSAYPRGKKSKMHCCGVKSTPACCPR